LTKAEKVHPEEIQGIPFVVFFWAAGYIACRNFCDMSGIKPKKRRVLGELKRDRRLTMNLTAAEFERLEGKAAAAGMTMAVYVRRVSLEGQVIARLGDGDRTLFMGVVEVSNMLDGLYKLARAEGVEQAMRSFEAGRDAVDGLLNRLKL
jgi:hypothetical protein